MTAYSFESNLVDVKAYNWHMSAQPDSTLGKTIDGTTATIAVGSLVTPGTDAGTIDNAQAGEFVIGVANETRNASDTRPLTYTWAGVVRVQTDTSAVLVGSALKAANQALAAVADPAGTAADLPKIFGRALEANGSASVIIMAYINCANV